MLRIIFPRILATAIIYDERIFCNFTVIKNFYISDASYRPADFIKTLPFNPEYISKKFAKETGNSPARQLMQMRIGPAKKMLRQQRVYGLTVKEIAATCGFADALYFSRVFKAATGKSPSEYALG